MEVTALRIRLLLLELTLLGAHVQTQKSDAAVLRISPNRLQFFEYESVTFHCEGTDGSIQLRRMKKTEDFVPVCARKRTPTGSSCTFDQIYLDDSGEYWCETKEGERSSRVQITVSAGSVILDSPARPVMEGSSVTLRCKSKADSANSLVHFHKDGTLMESSPAAHMTINNVSKLNEGLYMCAIDGEMSPGSFLAVRDVDFPQVVPNRQQHFEYESISISCEGLEGLTGRRVMKMNKKSTQSFAPDWSSVGPCKIKAAQAFDSGEYWCDRGTERSNTVTITVTAGSVILESPVHPVMEGDAVTLRCRKKQTSSSLDAEFFKDGYVMERNTTGDLTIQSVSMSHEGRYKCSISGAESAESWLTVRAAHGEPPSSPQPSPQPSPLSLLLCIGSSVLSPLLFVGLLQCWRHLTTIRGGTTTAPSSFQCSSSSQTVSVATYTAIITKPGKEKGC